MNICRKQGGKLWEIMDKNEMIFSRSGDLYFYMLYVRYRLCAYFFVVLFYPFTVRGLVANPICCYFGIFKT